MLKAKGKGIAGLLFLGLLGLLLAPQIGRAGQADERNISLSRSESFGGDYFNVGNSVNIAGDVSGDVIIAGGNLDVSGDVSGDVLAAGGLVDLNGQIGGSARVAGGSLSFAGKVGRNLTVAGANIKLDRDFTVLGNAYLAGDNIVIRGTGGGALVAAGRRVEIAGKISGDVTVYAENVSVIGGADISGGLTYYSNNQADISSDARIAGTVTQKPAYLWSPEKKTPFEATSKLGLNLWKILSFLVIALAAWRLSATRIRNLLSDINSNFWEKLLWGLLGVVAVPAGAAIAAATVVGLPLAFMVFGIYLMSLLLAGAYSFLAFGKLLGDMLNVHDKPESFPWYGFLLGAVVLSVIAYVPVIGPAAVLIVWLWSLGALYRSLGSS